MNGVYCKDCRRFDRDFQCCKVTSESKAEAKERECNQFRKRFISNGDFIRSMSNEELADVLGVGKCPPWIDRFHPCKKQGCIACWLDWLNAEAKEE